MALMKKNLKAKVRDKEFLLSLRSMGIEPRELSIQAPKSDIDNSSVIDYRLLMFKTLIKKKVNEQELLDFIALKKDEKTIQKLVYIQTKKDIKQLVKETEIEQNVKETD